MSVTELAPGGVREVLLPAGPLWLSGLLAEAESPRCLVVALHGAGMRAGYFDSRVRPGQSLVALGAQLGFSVLALDRPGYGHSAARLADGASLAGQAAALRHALDAFAGRYDTGGGVFLVGHSYGGKLALHAAADGLAGLVGVDVSGVGEHYAVDPAALADFTGRATWGLHWGGLSLYPPGTFRMAGELLGPMPAAERREALAWPERFASLAGRITVPVRLTYAEHERWWRHDETAVAAVAGALRAAPRVVVDRMPRAGHNISLGWAARAYHLRALAFGEECLLPAHQHGRDRT